MKSIKNFVNWYFAKQTFPHICVLLLDCIIILCSSIFVYWCYFRGMALQHNFWMLMRLMALFLAIHCIFFFIFKTYTGIIRYSSFNDLIKIGYAMGCSTIVIILVHFWTNNVGRGIFAQIQIRHIVTAVFMATSLMWLMRVSIKRVYDIYFRTDGAQNTVIYGIKSGGIGLAKAIRSEKPMRFRLKGFISHDPELCSKHTRLLGEPIFKVDENLTEELKQRGIQTVLVAPGRIDNFREDTVLQDYILAAGIKILSANNVVDTHNNTIQGTPSIKEVSISDLLPRNEITVDLKSIAESLTGQRILITGSAGSIGSEIVRQVASFAPESMILIDSAETPQHDIRLMMAKDYPNVKAETIVSSITKEDRMDNIFRMFRPDFVFHAAAYKHVPMMEDNPSESVQNNILGTKILADLAVKYGVRKFVMVSTDKAVNPTNVMGCSKRICEIYVQSLNKAENDHLVEGHTQFVTTRFGNVLGSNGSVIPLFKKQINEGGPVTVTDPKMIRYFMLIPEACKLVLEAGTKGNGGEIFVFDMGKPVLIKDLAERMIKLSGARGVEIEYTGLRDGEKLYEEVLNEKETTKPSFNEKIRIACVREYDYNQVNAEIESLIKISHEYDDMATVTMMKRIVPEYISNHSRYSALDNQNQSSIKR